MKNIEETSEKLLSLGKLALGFSRTYRKTLHEDGTTPESDTDHTVMLSLCCCSLAQKYYPDLNIGKIAEFGLVHDLIEAYTGDIPTFGMLPEDKKDKEAAEALALHKLEGEYGQVFPWIHVAITNYEKQDTKEARFVKLVDKIMPKVTQSLNQSAQFKAENLSESDTKSVHEKQIAYLNDSYGSDFPEMIDLLKVLAEKARSGLR